MDILYARVQHLGPNSQPSGLKYAPTALADQSIRSKSKRKVRATSVFSLPVAGSWFWTTNKCFGGTAWGLHNKPQQKRMVEMLHHKPCIGQALVFPKQVLPKRWLMVQHLYHSLFSFFHSFTSIRHRVLFWRCKCAEYFSWDN